MILLSTNQAIIVYFLKNAERIKGKLCKGQCECEECYSRPFTLCFRIIYILERAFRGYTQSYIHSYPYTVLRSLKDQKIIECTLAPAKYSRFRRIKIKLASLIDNSEFGVRVWSEEEERVVNMRIEDYVEGNLSLDDILENVRRKYFPMANKDIKKSC